MMIAGRVLLAALLAIGPPAAMTSCAGVTLISRYDEQVDQSATRLQKSIDAFLTRLQATAGTADASYVKNRPFYDEYRVELRAVESRALAAPRNERTVEQLTLMQGNLDELEEAHRDGPLRPAAIDEFRKLFLQGWRAILALELAKKRNEKVE